ncbi:ABC transporter ATP-binding protein [Undibacterium rugosum]|uniref:Spermidine/putrescine import ATP-binding protein PotA n=1 Tax=Undibacterium rugosum TaxID=2762291 RepID=A0A923I182_9BURK|nr:polyamine ABC transporter ATP-binding protein [Undibacterium rugosum]MBC3935918.1 polyamine ABC transporter ATP-binding protein [Undibacterium rugosum]MBR7779299.1 polyamine ABC transporter ATP-binding protein [Undibacterium rugosum]
MTFASYSALPSGVELSPVSKNDISAGQPFLIINNLVKEFGGVKAVNNVSVTINKGEIFALLGSSGCGKSTLLRMLAGFETPTSGQLLLAGEDIINLPPYRRPINMMFQSYALFPHLSVWDNIAFGLRRDGMPKDQVAERVENMLDLVQLTNYAKRKPHQLSGGQQQRVALARSLAKRPQLLLLDEPLGALDKKLRERTQMELVNILAQVGVTCVMVTHDQEEAMSMASRIAIMSEGHILQIGKPAEIYETPDCRFVADFIGNINMFDGTLIEDEPDHVVIESQDCLHYVGHGITGTIGMALSVGVRPEKISVGFEMTANSANCVKGKIIELAYMGSYTVYHLQLTSGMVLKASTANTLRHDTHRPQWGDTVFASWSSDAMVVLTR